VKHDHSLLNRPRQAASGNGAILVIVNGAGGYWDRYMIEETVLLALEHYGMPYRVLDLASEQIAAATLKECAGIILAQHHLGRGLTAAAATLIAEAVKNGVGLVNLDNDLQEYPSPLLEIFAFDGINPHPFATNLIRIPTNGHYITELQCAGEYHQFKQPVTGTIVEKWRQDVVPLAEAILGKEQLIYIRHMAPWSAFEPRNYAILFAANWGKGRAVQFTLNPRVWHKAFFGHGSGIDDLFWRSILWTVRKPFAANIIPPFVTLSVDDCSGRHDFRYMDLAVKNNYVPLIALFLRLVPERLFPQIKEGQQSGKVQFSTHALDYYTLLAFNFGRGECTPEELEERFAYDAAWWKKVGTSPGATIRFHWGEWGVQSLPYCKKLGRVFFCPAVQTGLHDTDMNLSDGFWPYNLQTCYYDYLPDDPDFFGFASLGPRHEEDFLTGCTANLRESDHTNIEKAAHNAATQISHGLRSAFYGEVLTHEQKIGALDMEEWDKILKTAAGSTKSFEKIFVGHDEIARYLKGKAGVTLEKSSVDGTKLHCVVSGATESPLRLSVFRNEGNSVSREYVAVKRFNGREELSG
jgi:hypothetical protein